MPLLTLRRPLYVFALLFFFTTAVLVGLNEQYGLLTAAIAAMAFLLVMAVPSLRKITALTACTMAVLLASLLVYTRYLTVVQPLEKLSEKDTAVTVRLTELPRGSSKLYRATVTESDTVPVGSKLCVSFADKDVSVERYDVVSGTISLYLPSAEQQYLHGDGIFLMGYFPEETTVTDGTVMWYERVANGWRDTMLHGMRALAPDKTGELLAGVCFGEISSLDEDVQTDFRKSGLTHLLVVSGLHMTLLSNAVYTLLRKWKVNRWLSLGITLLLLWLFMLMVGFTSSVVRAAVMLHFVLIGRSVRLRADAHTSLAVALLLILLQNPYAALDVGFLLSFAATLGLMVFTPLWNKVRSRWPVISKHGFLDKPAEGLATSLAAAAFTSPILAYTFGTLPVLSPLANVFAVWPTTLLLYCGMIGAVLCCIPFLAPLAEMFFFVGGLLAKWVMWVAKTVGDISVSQLQIRHGAILLLLIIIPLAVCWGYKLLGGRGALRMLISGVVITALCGGMLTFFSRAGAMIRVASGEDSFVALVESRGQAVAFLSATDHYACVQARRFLVSCGVDSLDTLVITDGTTEGTAALSQLLETVPATTVMYPEDEVDITAGIGHIQRVCVNDTMSMPLGNSMVVAVHNGWWRLTIGETRLLIAPSGGSFGDITREWRQAHITVLREDVPKGSSLSQTQRVVMLCPPQNVSRITGDLPWGVAAVHLAALDGEAAYCTFGNGDVVPADRYFL